MLAGIHGLSLLIVMLRSISVKLEAHDLMSICVLSDCVVSVKSNMTVNVSTGRVL